MAITTSYVQNVIVLGIGSDIGRELARRYLNAGCRVFGVYRTPDSVRELKTEGDSHFCLVQGDLGLKETVQEVAAQAAAWNHPWDLFISAVGTMEPAGPFFSVEFDNWEQSVKVNALAQLRVLHALYPHRRSHALVHAAFFAGGGTNNPFPNFSAYCVSKICLIKMCELLDDETPDLNMFILGPGWVRTKIHKEVLGHPEEAGDSYWKTQEFMESGKQGTPFEDIYEAINWCVAQGRGVAGGRNLSIVHDPWRNGGEKLAEQLRKDSNKFKLRRHRNAD